MTEFRRYKRVYLAVPLQYCPFNDPDSQYQTTLLDFTPDGIGFTAKCDFDNGQLMDVSINFNNDLVVDMVVRKVWAMKSKDKDEFRIGAQIHDMGPGARRILTEFYKEKCLVVFGKCPEEL